MKNRFFYKLLIVLLAYNCAAQVQSIVPTLAPDNIDEIIRAITLEEKVYRAC